MEGRTVAVWDPLAMDEARPVFGNKVTFCADGTSCIERSDLAVVTLPLPSLNQIDWSKGANTTVLDCWRVLPMEARQAVGRYMPLGIGGDEDMLAWIRRVGGTRHDLLTS